MQFVLIVERNCKEDESFLSYCQWQGNEEELEKLFKIIDEKDDSELYGDVGKFSYSRVLLSESAVDEHMKIQLGTYTNMFHKCVGTFKCPTFTECESIYTSYPSTEFVPRDPKQRARWYAELLDRYFYHARFSEYFK